MSMSHNEMIAVIAAHRDGKPVQVWNHAHQKWYDLPSDTLPGEFAFNLRDYRVKSEPPKPREFWIAPAPLGICAITSFPQVGYIHVREVLPDEEGKA